MLTTLLTGLVLPALLLATLTRFVLAALLTTLALLAALLLLVLIFLVWIAHQFFLILTSIVKSNGELPPKMRRVVLNECARVLKPGGRLVLIDSVQRGDRPDYEGMLELFPKNYHEPTELTKILSNVTLIIRFCLQGDGI